ncbi:MAG: prephenate dehydratase domain-containing protein [Saprospiraceae bacterium]
MNTSTDTITEVKSEIQKKKICIQGYEGAFHEIASRFFYGEENIDVRPCHTFEELVDVLNKNEEADGGLMAIENTLGGSLMYNFNLLSDSDLFITGEIYLRIKQNLMVNPDVELSDIKEVHSHPMAIAQCREYFRKMPHIRLVETADTALSARNIKENNSKHIGAIASTLAADLYGLNIIAPSIETNKKREALMNELLELD